MAFRFSLETLLRVRSLRAEVEERKLLLLRREVEVLHQELTAMQERLVAHTSARFLSGSPVVRGCEIALLSAETDDLHRQVERLRERCLRAESQEREQRLFYQAAGLEKEVVLELKKRQRQSYEKLLRRKEQKMADEAFLTNRSRRL